MARGWHERVARGSRVSDRGGKADGAHLEPVDHIHHPRLLGRFLFAPDVHKDQIFALLNLCPRGDEGKCGDEGKRLRSPSTMSGNDEFSFDEFSKQRKNEGPTHALCVRHKSHVEERRNDDAASPHNERDPYLGPKVRPVEGRNV